MNTRNIFKQSLILAAIFGLIFVASSSMTIAAPVTFTSKYGYGMRNSPEVSKLQQFLKDIGYYSGPVTGNYLNETMDAVASFQVDNNIVPTGIFGPTSRNVANTLLMNATVNSTAVNPMTIRVFSPKVKKPATKKVTNPVVNNNQTSLSLISPVSGTIEMGQTQSIKWSSTKYTADGVTIRLIRKVGDNPERYEVVRTISDVTLNDGNATWVPAASDVGTDLSIEIGCRPSTSACQAANSVGSSLAVIKSDRYSNTASAFQAIEAVNNK